MNALKLLAALTVGCLLGTGARAEEKPEYAKQIVGKWEVTKADEGTVPPGATVEFTKDGKVLATHKADGKDETVEGTYKVEGDTLTVTMKRGGEEHMQTITITKMSKSEMSTKNKDGKAVDLKRKV
jgi:uncharacterized protein (TIGR03066 family)